jgi:hypothetical protein
VLASTSRASTLAAGDGSALAVGVDVAGVGSPSTRSWPSTCASPSRGLLALAVGLDVRLVLVPAVLLAAGLAVCRWGSRSAQI